MRLKESDKAPNFMIKDTQGNSFNLEMKRDKLLMLSFFRYASCPLCNLRVHKLIQEYENLKDQLDIVMVFQSPKEKIEHYVGKQDIPYTILPDPKRNLYKLYKVEYSWIAFLKAWTLKIKNVFSALFKYHYLPGSVEGEIHRVPADFIIDTDGKILRAFYGKDIGDHLPLEEIKKIVDNYETRR
jgi:thioredoxin-dependent peroxiredoxin